MFISWRLKRNGWITRICFIDLFVSDHWISLVTLCYFFPICTHIYKSILATEISVGMIQSMLLMESNASNPQLPTLGSVSQGRDLPTLLQHTGLRSLAMPHRIARSPGRPVSHPREVAKGGDPRGAGGSWGSSMHMCSQPLGIWRVLWFAEWVISQYQG